MKAALRERRGAAAERHDAALARCPSREGSVFTDELRAVAAELEDVAAKADVPSSDPVEVAKTYRWLGDAYFDLARGRDEEPMIRGSNAYKRAEELLAGAEAPLEKAKLNFNYANTLRGLSEGSDITLLEEARNRYSRALDGFRTHAPQYTAQVEQTMSSIEPQIALAQTYDQAKRGYEALERIMNEIPGVKHVYSASSRGMGVVTVRFKVGEITGPSLVKVHDKLASNLDKMPTGVQMPPLVKAKGIDDVPVVTLTLWSPELDGGSLRRLGLNLLQHLNQIPNTGQGFVVGGQSEEIRVEILPNKFIDHEGGCLLLKCDIASSHDLRSKT